MINAMTKKALYDGEILINNKTITRHVLGISDVSRAIKEIVDKPMSGVYNLASFADTVQNISGYVSTILNVKIQETINVSGMYDFAMNTDKFKSTYNFEFKESIKSIVDEITDKFEKAEFSNRNKFIKYE
jgi:nucleoside-diphosphate-sugar epimerase